MDKRVNEFIRKCEPSDLREDLLHHCILELYRIAEKYPGKIEALHNAGELWPWFHGLISRQLMSDKSTFYTKFRRKSMVYLPVEELPDRPIYQVDGFGECDAVERLGSNFVNYFYDQFPKRNQPKQKAAAVQISLF